MESVIYKEWRNQNDEIAFPFNYEMAQIDNDIFVDASIAIYGSPIVWLSFLSIKDDSIYGELKTSNLQKLTFSLKGDDIEPYKMIDVVSNGRNAAGKIVIGSYFDKNSKGRKSLSKYFEDMEIVLNPICVFSYSSNQVPSINVNSSKSINGFVNFHEGPGVEVNGRDSVMVVDSVGKNTSLISEECCDPDQVILKSINGVIPIDDINISIKQKDTGQPSNTLDKRQVIRINQVENGIKIEIAK